MRARNYSAPSLRVGAWTDAAIHLSFLYPKWVALLGVCLFFCSINHAYAAEKTLMRERVVAVLKGGEIQLEKTGKAVFQNLLVRDAARMENWLAEHVLQKEIPFTLAAEDRYGRRQIISDLQEQMLRDGVVLVYATHGDISADWRRAEAQARQEKRGIWANESRVITPQEALALKDGFYLVEGVITRIYESKNATYLNFGDDWRRDLSTPRAAKQRRSMNAFLSDLKAGERIRVRVRGSIIEENGPMIILNHKDNLEKL